MPIWFPHGLGQAFRLEAHLRGSGAERASPAPSADDTSGRTAGTGISPRLQDTLASLSRPAEPQGVTPYATAPGAAAPQRTRPHAEITQDRALSVAAPRPRAADGPGLRAAPRQPASAPQPRASAPRATASSEPAGRGQPGTLRLGVVGVGYWGAKHVRALEKVDGVSAVVAIDQRLGDAPDGSLAALGIDQYGELESALPHVDALVIATPPSTHTQVGLQAIAAGKHVLIEKPLATSAAEARSLVEAADAAGVVLMSGHTFEHNAAVHKLRDLVRGRDLGQLYYLDCARLSLGLYRDDVGVIADLAPHDISIANYVLGSRPTTVTAWGSRFVGPEHEDVAFLRLDYADVGVRASIQVSWLSPVKVRRITAVGSQRMAVYDDLAEDERIRIYDKSAVPPARDSGEQRNMTYHRGDTIMPHVEFAEPLAVQDQEFVSCIRTGRKPAADGNSGLTVVQVLDAAQLSLREQRPVSIAEISQPAAVSTALQPAGDPPLRIA